VRTLLFLLMLIVFALAVQHSLLAPSMSQQEEACARKCQAEGFRSHEFMRPGTGGPRDQVVRDPCRCVR
jgi:hypothetical protein